MFPVAKARPQQIYIKKIVKLANSVWK